jgi:hemoglobin
MKFRLGTALLLAGLTLSAPVLQAGAGKKAAPAKGSRQAANDFKAFMQRNLDAWSTLDPANAAPFYAQEANHVFYDIAPLKYSGWGEYSEGAKKLVGMFSSLKFTLGNDVETHRQGNLAWGTATVRTDLVTKGGAREAMDGRWTVVWEKRGKDWLIVHEHFSVPLPAPVDTASLPLYKRLGGYDALAAVVDDFIGRLTKDPNLARFFAGHSSDSLKRIRQLVVDQLCEATGGPCVYIGRSMQSSHAGLGITENDWQASVTHLVETLDKFKVPTKEKDEVLSSLSGLKKDIVKSD